MHINKINWLTLPHVADCPLENEALNYVKSILAADDCPSFKGASKGQIILEGPPGSGKSFFAKAVAAEIARRKNLKNDEDMMFFITLSTILSSWKGKSVRCVRCIYEMARKMKPIGIVMDEIDSIVTTKDKNDSSTTQIARQLQTLIEGDLANNDGIYLIGTTNHIDKIKEQEPAFLQRFQVFKLGLPTAQERRKIIDQKSKEYECCLSSEDVSTLVQFTRNCTVRDISNLFEDALLHQIELLNKTKFWKILDDKKTSGEEIWCYFPSNEYPKAPERDFQSIKIDVKIPDLTLEFIVYFLLKKNGAKIVDRCSRK